MAKMNASKPKSCWNSLSEKTQNLAKFISAVLVLGGFVVSVCSWGINQVMRTVDDRFNELSAQIESNDLENRRATRRLELLNLIHHQPQNKAEIEKVADDYFANLGGDWYASNIYSQWANEYDGDVSIVFKEEGVLYGRN